MSRLDDLEARLKALEGAQAQAAQVTQAVPPDPSEALAGAISTLRTEFEAFRVLVEDKVDPANEIGRNCDLAGDAMTLVMSMHAELDDMLRRHLGVGFEAKGFTRLARSRWRP